MASFQAYPLEIESHPDEGGYLAVFPTLPGCQSWGETWESAVRNAEAALAVYVETPILNGDPIPASEMSANPTALGIIVRTDLAA